jgi:plastocyanin
MRRTLLIPLMVLGLIAAGCGGDDDDDGGDASTAAPVELDGKVTAHGDADVSDDGDDTAVELEVDDFYFAPTYVKAAPSQTIQVELENEGDASHTFTIDERSIDEELEPGASRTVTVELPASGVLTYYCRFHRGQGMQGALYFNAGDRAGGDSSSTTAADGYR